MAKIETMGGQSPGVLESLTTYLRDNPSALGESAEKLAAEFGLPVTFVENVLGELRGPVSTQTGWQKIQAGGRRLLGFLKSAGRAAGRGLAARFELMTERPLVFLVTTGAAAIGMLLLRRTTVATSIGPIYGTVAVSTVIVIFAMHLVSFFRNAQIRYPLVGALLMASVLWLSSLLDMPRPLVATRFGATALVTLAASTVMSVFYAAFGSAASILGAFVKLNRETRREKRQTRQELLGRLLEIEQQLKATNEEDLTKAPEQNLLERCRTTKWFPLFSFAVGSLLGVFEVAVLGSFSNVVGGFDPSRLEGVQRVDILIVMVTVFFAVMVAYLTVGYLAGRVWRSIFCVGLVWAGRQVATLIPFGPFGLKYVTGILSTGFGISSLAVVVLTGLLTGLGASVDLDRGRKRKLKSNDPAQLVAESVLLQWRLNLGSRDACVMSVDVAGSTKMKASADPLRIEYSFRAYQGLVEEVSGRHAGQVFSTAGDGAIVAFPSTKSALAAARDIQTEMRLFNERKNRLDDPFQIRIGLHTGETQAQLGDAPFNELIDIAAHIEHIAPVRGIALSGTAAKHLPDVKLAELAQTVDGQKVYIDIDPTGDV